jgi:hypothetical protein
MSNPLVKCCVDECTHYMSGDQCMASHVSIYNNESLAQSVDCQDTQCKSFHSKKDVGDIVGALHNANVVGTVTAPFMDGTQITPNVECFVDNCNYWSSHNICQASQIKVGGRSAASTVDTDCETFKLKD